MCLMIQQLITGQAEEVCKYVGMVTSKGSWGRAPKSEQLSDSHVKTHKKLSQINVEGDHCQVWYHFQLCLIDLHSGNIYRTLTF